MQALTFATYTHGWIVTPSACHARCVSPSHHLPHPNPEYSRSSGVVETPAWRRHCSWWLHYFCIACADEAYSAGVSVNHGLGPQACARSYSQTCSKGSLIEISLKKNTLLENVERDAETHGGGGAVTKKTCMTPKESRSPTTTNAQVGTFHI
jgi:hypothetical protein